MNVVELHPEELLDRHAEGSLTEVERARLGAHVATCAACRFELAARRDFAGVAVALPRSALVIDPYADTRKAAPSGRSAPVASRGKKKRAIVLVALAAALVAGGSLAAIAVRVLARSEMSPATQAAVNMAGPAAAGGTPKGAPPLEAPRVQSAGPETASVTVKLDDLPLAVTAATAVPSAAPSEAIRAERGGPSPSAAAALFREANDARRDGDGTRAIALYRRLEAQHPSSEEARLSYATLGRLLLDRGDARSALEGFDEYLSHGSAALGEEALVGRALSLQKLGSRDAEIAAWQEILRRFPKSVHARLARSRLSALGQR
jgi:TolA-binding protein